MRYAILSDIHGNLEALEASLERLNSEKIDAYISPGDIVGYGADPSGCIKIVRSLDPTASVAGNHDQAVVGSFDPAGFNEYAKAAVLWTRSVLSAAELEYLKSLPLVKEGKVFSVVHGSLEDPQEFNYILNRADAARSMRHMATPLLFVGHSHVPAIYGHEGSPKRIVNAGSVGQPRDGDPRASFVIYDDSTGDVSIVRVEYDIEKARKKIIDAGLPEFLGDRLRGGL